MEIKKAINEHQPKVKLRQTGNFQENYNLIVSNKVFKAKDDSHINDDNNHLEIFSLIWLDPDVNVQESRDIQQKLRTIINHLKKFQDEQECQRYVEQRSQTDRLVLIVSGRLGRGLVPSIHQLRQISSIYVYCNDKKSNEEWAYKFPKIRAVIVEPDELVSQLRADHKIRMKVEEPLSINIFTTSASTGKSTTGVNGQFVFSQLLIECILRMKSNEMDKNELISHCMNEYAGNKMELANLREFQQSYLSDQALQWYTRESFFYKTLNKALRSQDIHMIFLYRSFIVDICDQLQQHQSKCPLRVYRSQLMSSDELNVLKQYIDQFISVNSFLSTSNERSVALFYMGDTTKVIDLERVLFEIDADPRVVTTKPFADISSQSNFTDELEVLFMLGSIFRLNDISRGNNQVWIVRLTLWSDDEHNLEQVLMHMKNQNGNGETNLRTLGKLLWEMGKLALAEKYYTRLLNELPSNDPLLITLYEELGKIASQNGDYDMSIEWHHKSFTIKQRNMSTGNANFDETRNSIGPLLLPNIHPNDRWTQNGVTVAGGHGYGGTLNLLWNPIGLYIDDDDDQTVLITDYNNHRIVEWKCGATSGQVVAGGNGHGNRTDQLSGPTDVIIDKQTDSLIICDLLNQRVMRWPRRGGTNGQTIISDVTCTGLTMDDDGFLYVADEEKNEVRRWRAGETTGTVVAGANERGDRLDQLNFPTFIFVNRDHSVYVSDWNNHRVMQWVKGTKEGIIVAGGQGQGNALTQLSNPRGVIVDQAGTVYVADCRNHRIMRWPKGATEGSIVFGGNGRGQQANQLFYPTGLSFDRYGNLYVVDRGNDRVQRFSIDHRS